MDTNLSEAPIVSFRPVKRQKYMRKRAEESDDVQSSESAQIDTSVERDNVPKEYLENEDLGEFSKIMRPRKLNRMRKGGIEFSTGNSQFSDKANMALAVDASETDILKAKLDRFTTHSGQTVDVDKHMMEYIESELAKRHNHARPDDKSSTTDLPDNTAGNYSFSNAFSKREPATLGKLHEIDLGQEAKLQNIARTEAATRRITGDESTSFEKLQSGENDRGWRTRRRNSEDIERDRLVEEVLRESKLDVYDEPEQSTAQDDQAADDRIAEQFRRDFMEAIQNRRRTMRARASTHAQKKRTTKPEAPRGPKLGGSRSARAAMREMQEKSAKK